MFSRPVTGLDRSPGRAVPDFSLIDVRTGQVNHVSGDRDKLLVIVFVGTSCPVGDLYVPRLVELSLKYESQNVDFLAINSNFSESIDDVAAYARRSKVTFPVLKDTDNRVADQLLVERTCEALLIDAHGVLRYRGAIDDQYGLGTRRDNAVHTYLADAIEAVLAGREVSPSMTHVVGCPIERTVPERARRSLSRREGSSPAAEPRREQDSAFSQRGEPVTYAKDVAPILHARCATCHRQGQVAPFSLLTYDQARRWAASIAEVVADRRMPPWHADPSHGEFANDRSLSSRERDLLSAWVEQGAPPGDLASAPEPPGYPQGWSIGTPDLVYEMPETYQVKPEGILPLQHIRVATTHTEDLYVQAAEARPGDRAVVHHICVYIEERGKKKKDEPRNKNLLVAYTPGDMPSVYAPGVAKKIPPGVDLVFEVHYTPIGQVRFDRSSVGVILAKEPPRHLAVTQPISQRDLEVPPGAHDHVEHASWDVPRDAHLLSMTPHMHFRGKSFVFTAHYPDRRNETLLSVPAYDFNWQSAYRLAVPKSLPAETTIHCEAHFDNSSANSANPDPSQTVLWGEQMTDEMMIGFIDYYEDEPRAPASPSRTGE